MKIRHTRRAPLATLIAVAALMMGASSASAAGEQSAQPDPRVRIAPSSDGIWDIEHDGYADAAASAAGLSRPFWPAAFDSVLA